MTIKKNYPKVNVNELHNRLRKKLGKQRFENRILLGLFFSVVAVLFYVGA